jgi:hypothetical protein
MLLAGGRPMTMMFGASRPSRVRALRLNPIFVLLMLIAGPVTGGAQEIGDIPTFSADVAPILQESCLACHNPEGIGPMSLETYAQVRPWAAMIMEQTQTRHMPPWHLDKEVGIQDFKNDISLTDGEIETIARWVDAGAPEGNPADLPPTPNFPTGGAWQAEEELGRPPDIVIRSTPFTVPALGQDQWWGPQIPFEGLEEERWIMAAEFKPAFPDGKKVVHHGHAVLSIGEERGIGIARYGVGKSWEIYPDGVGLRIPPGEGLVSWNLHYAATDHDVVGDVVEVGLWLYPEGETPRLASEGEVLFRADNPDFMRGQDILIPPHGYQVLQGVHKLESAAVLHSVRPHMHTRGKTMTLEAIYPDGTKEVLSQINNYDHNWQNTYTYADHARPLLPQGTLLVITSVFDNTANNPINPDPDQWVIFGRRGPDEMSHLWIGITYVPDEELERLVSEREDYRDRGIAQVSTGGAGN